MLTKDVDLKLIAEQTDGYTGADLAGLVRQAAMLALKQSVNDENANDADELCVTAKHFEEAIRLLRPSVGAQVSQSNSFETIIVKLIYGQYT